MEGLAGRGLLLNAEPIRDPAEDSRYYVFLRVEPDAQGVQLPSRGQIADAVAEFKERGLSIEVLLIDTKSLDIEAGIRASLIHAFPNFVRNAFLTNGQRGVTIWIDPKRTLDEDTRSSIADRARVFLRQFDLAMESLSTLGEGNVPGRMAVLAAIRHAAPVLPEALIEMLQARGFTVPSVDWMRRRLDAHRKAGEVVRLQDGSYAPNAAVIRALGTAQNKRSPDISRLLALARGKR